MISFDEMKDDAKVLAHLDSVLFVDSSITLSDEEYLKENIKSKLVYNGCMTNHLFSVNESVNDLEQSQATYIFCSNPEDVRLLLNLTLTNSPIKIEKAEETEAKLKKNAEQQGDLGTLIEVTKSAEGTYRVRHDEGYFHIELPVVVNPEVLDWKNLSEVDAANFLVNCLNYAAGVTQTLSIPEYMFSDEIKNFVLDLPRLMELGFEHARKSSMNSVEFKTVKDPFKSLFDGMLNGTF